MMFDTVNILANPKRKTDTKTIAEVNGVTAILSTFELTETGESAYGVRVFKGDPDNGPYESWVTELYYDAKHALYESLTIAGGHFGIETKVWSEAIGLD
jgi:hypothetical protein